MDVLDLLSKQLESYQEQNVKEHKELSNKIDQMLTELHVLYSERNVNEKRFDNLEEGQVEIKETVNKIEERVKNLEERDLKRDHTRNLALKTLGVLTAIGALIGLGLRFL